MDDYGMKVQATVDLPSVKKIDEQIRALEKGISKLKVSGQFDDVALKNLTNQLNTLKVNIGTVNFSSAALTELTSQVEKALNNINISGANIGKQITQNITENIDAGVVSQINKISDSSTSTIVQNEKKKQEAYKATSDAVVYHAGVISKLNKAETNGRFYGSNRGTGYFGTGHYFVDSKTKHELDNNSSYSKLPYTSVDISKYDNLFKATTDEIASKLHSFLENLTKFTQGSDRFNIDELFSQFKNVFTDTTMDIKDFGDKMEQLKSFMSNSNLSDRSDSVSTQFMKSLGYGGVDTRGTKYADTRYGTVIYDLKEESVLQANITDELQKQGQMLEKINYEKGQVFDSSADAKIQEQIDTQNRLLQVKEEFKKSFNTANLDSSQAEFDAAQKRLAEIDDIISDCKYQIDHADEAAKKFAKDMADLGLEVSDEEMKDWKQDTATSYQNRIEELSLERAELEKRIPILEENYNKESQLASEAYKQAEQIVEQRRLEAQQSSTTANEVIQNEEKKQQAIQNTNNTYKSFSELKIGTGNINAIFDKDGVLDIEQSLKSIRDTYSEFGKVKITNKLFDPDGSLKQFRIEIQQTNGDLKESRNFMMALSEDGKSFCFPEDAIRGAESFVHHLNDGKKASNDVLTEEQKLANIMGDVREKTELARQAEEQRQQTAQNKVINKSLEDEYKQRQKLADKIHEIQLSMDTGETESKVDALIVKTNQWTDVNGNARISTQSLTAALDALRFASNVYIQTPTEEKQKELIEANEKLSVEYKKIASDVRSMNATLAKDSAVDSLRLQYQNFYSENGKAHKKFGEQLKSAMSELSRGAEVPKQKVEELKKELIDTKTVCKELGLTGQTWFQNLGDKIKQLSTYLSGTVIIGKLLQTGKQMVDNVSKIDSSLVELEKVSDLTTDGLEKVTDKAFELGKDLSKIGTNVLDSVTSFKRAGYDISDSMEYAEEALKTTNISENLKNAGQAADSLVNIMKGFQNESPEFARKINDAVNQVSNTEAVDFDNLIDGATRLSAVADQAGMSFEQMLGTLTGGYEILGNMEKVATGQITIFSRLQAIQLDGEEEVSTVAKLQKTFNNATKGAVNIVDQTTGQLRNVYDILDDVANVWDNLDKNTREALAIEAAGIRQKNVFLAMMQNWDGVKDAVESASNSFGSADEENEKYIKSIQGRVENFERSVQQLSRTVLDSDLVKFFVDLGTTGINAIDKIIDKLGSLGTIGTIGGGLLGAKGQG